MGVNKKYDCFDCQKNTFSVANVGPCCMIDPRQGVVLEQFFLASFPKFVNVKGALKWSEFKFTRYSQ